MTDFVVKKKKKKVKNPLPFFSLNKHQQQLSYCSCSHTVYVLCLSAPCVGINLIMNFIID